MQPSSQMGGMLAGLPQQPLPGNPLYPYGGQQQLQQNVPSIALTKDEQRKEKRRKERAMMQARANEKAKADADSTVRWMTYGTLINGLLLLLPIFGNAWIYKRFTGAGLKMMHISTSLFYIDIEIQCGKNWLEDKLCKAGDAMNGHHSLQQASQMACAISPAACGVMSRTYYSSFIIFVFFAMAIICNLLAAMFLNNYWHQSKLPKMRTAALYFFAAGPLLSISGFVIWNVIDPDIGELPRALTTTTNILSGGGVLGSLFSYKEVASFPFGWCWLLTVFALMLQTFVFLCWPIYFVKSEGEEAALEEEEREQERIEEELLAQYDQQQQGYGTMPQQGYGTMPPEQQQGYGTMPFGNMPPQYGDTAYQNMAQPMGMETEQGGTGQQYPAATKDFGIPPPQPQY